MGESTLLLNSLVEDPEWRALFISFHSFGCTEEATEAQIMNQATQVVGLSSQLSEWPDDMFQQLAAIFLLMFETLGYFIVVVCYRALRN